MKNAKKILALLMCAVLLVGASIAGTVAYLTDKDDVTNTFTVGKVNIKLDEAVLDKETGKATADPRTEEGNTGMLLIPGRTIDKDPTVTVLADSEACYVRAKVYVANLDNLKTALPGDEYYLGDVFLLQNLCVDAEGKSTWDGATWEMKTFDPATNTYEFWYKDKVAKAGTDTKLPALFSAFTVPGEDITSENINQLAGVQIIVTAEAIPAEGFADAAAAWAAFSA